MGRSLTNLVKSYFSLQYLVITGAVLLIGLGMTVIVGWLTHEPHLIQISPQFVPMQFNTALGFIMVGVSVIALESKHRAMARLLGTMTALLAILTLVQYAFGINLGIDELFMEHYITTATSNPGRMGPNTAVNFIMSCIAIIAVSTRKITINQLLIEIILGALVTGLGTVAWLGYFGNVEPAYGWGKLTHMAFHTSCGFMIVGLTLIAHARHCSFITSQKMPLFVLPMTISIFGFTVTFALWQALNALQSQMAEYYGINITNFIAEAILILGSLFSLALALAVWFWKQSQQQVCALEQAQAKILKLNQELENLSYLDALTGIANRRMFDLTAERELNRARREQRSIALILFDIDYFKYYNDYYGHLQGDQCLKIVASEIEKMARRPTDVAVRYGGEEFVLLLPDADPISAREIAEAVFSAIAHLQIPHTASKISDIITMSAGISACIPQSQTTLEQLIIKADQALYQAKNEGRGRIVTLV